MAGEYVFAAMQLKLNPTHKLVLMCLCNYVSHDDECWPTINTLSELTGYCKSTVEKSLRYLCENNFFYKSHRFSEKDGRQTSNCYRLNPKRFESHERIQKKYKKEPFEDPFKDMEIVSATLPDRTTYGPPPLTTYAPSPVSGTDLNTLTNETTNINNKNYNKKIFSKKSFEKWYAFYPNKKARYKAEQIWGRLSEENQQAALEGVQRYLHYLQLRKKHNIGICIQFIPYPSTWLNRGSWQDELFTEEEIIAEAKTIIRPEFKSKAERSDERRKRIAAEFLAMDP